MAESVRRLMFLVGTYYFLQGMSGNPGLHEQTLKKFLKESWNYSPEQSAAFFAFLTIPWMIKPLYGLISDFFPIFGSRRKNYFFVMGCLTALSYGLLSWMGATKGVLAQLLFMAAVGVAFSDVLCDAIMVEKGQPLNATGRLQSAQWFLGPAGLAGILVAFSKGYIAENLLFSQAALFSMAFVLVMMVFTAFALKEEKSFSRSGEAAKNAWRGIKSAVQSKTLWACSSFIFLFQLNPNFGSVFYYYERDVLKFSDVLIGHIDTAGALAFLGGAALFGWIEKRISYGLLLKTIISSGVLANFSYLFFRDTMSAFAVVMFASFVGATALLGVLTLAAKACPKYAEGTVFALLMSVYNLSTQIGSVSGAAFYERIGYSWLVIISAAFTACMWFFLPLVRSREDSNKMNAA